MLDPYFGITDFTKFWQVEDMLRIFKKNKPKGSTRKLHVGVMMSYKTLNEIPTKWQNVFPPKDTIAEIFSLRQTYNCLHYADYDDQPELWKSLSKAIMYGGTNIHAVQLDMIWPDPGMVAHGVHTSRKQIEVILQINGNALAQVGDDPRELVKKLEDYETVIQRVLLDKSMGKGIPMNAAELLPFAEAIRKRFPNLGLVAAGGLGPDTMHLPESLFKRFPDISFDAQGKLRPSGNAREPIHWNMAGDYLVDALARYG